MKTGTAIKKILSQRKMTIKQLAEKADIPLNTLYSITKRNNDNVKSANISKVLVALEITAEEFYMRKAGHETSINLSDQEKAFEWLLLKAFNRLNNVGKAEALKRIAELGMIETYAQRTVIEYGIRDN